MRSRSGAFHADSEETFIELALASQNTTGIFYDQKTNKKVMNKMHAKCNQDQAGQQVQSKVSKFETQKENNSFFGFDFCLEFQADKQEREQLERMREQPLKQINVGIISKKCSQVLQDLSLLFGVAIQREQLFRGVNLVISTRGQVICKYWIFDRDTLNEKDQLIQLYLNHCTQLYDYDETYHQINTLRSESNGDVPWIRQNLSTILI